MKNKNTVLFFLLFFLFPLQSFSQNPHSQIVCNYISGDFFETSKTRYYVINVDSFFNNSGGTLDRDAVEAAIVSSAETWNSMGNVNPLVYAGRTTLESLKDDLSDCQSANANISLFTMEPFTLDDPYTSNAQARRRCFNSLTQRFEQFHIAIYSKRRVANNSQAALQDIDWTFDQYNIPTCSSTSDSKDLEGMLVHEIGHVYNLGHTSDDAVMKPSTSAHCWLSSGGSSSWSDIRRDLMPYDLFCSNLLDSLRISPFGTTRNTNINYQYLSNLVSTGLIKDQFKLSSLDFSGLEYYSFNGNCLQNSDTQNCVSSDAIFAHIPPESFYFNDNSYVVFGNDITPGRNYTGIDYSFRRNIRITTKNNQSQLSEPVSLCNTIFQGTCINPTTANSTRKATVAYIPSLDLNALVWSNHRPENVLNKTIGISMIEGVGSDLVERWGLVLDENGDNIKSDISPGMACDKSSPDYECIIAHVDPDDMFSEILITKINITKNQNQDYVFQTSKSNKTNIQTSSAVNLWFADNYYWMVIRSNGYLNETIIYRSLGGNSWTAISYGDDFYLHNIDAVSHDENTFPLEGTWTGN